MEDYALKDLFQQLKPVCDATLLNPTRENITNMMAVVEKSNDLAFQHLWEYAVVPIHYHINRCNSNDKVNRYEIFSRYFVETPKHILKPCDNIFQIDKLFPN